MSKIKRYSIYEKSRQPKEGWLQQCFKCNEYTSKLLLFSSARTPKNTKIEEYWVHLCSNCEYSISNNILDFIKFNKKCNHYINTKINN